MGKKYDLSYFDLAIIDINQDDIPELYLADVANQVVGGIYTFNGVLAENIFQVENRQFLYGYHSSLLMQHGLGMKSLQNISTVIQSLMLCMYSYMFPVMINT